MPVGGGGAFDPKFVGAPTVGPADGYWHDVDQIGDANAGQTWDADWTDAQRRASVEYLKTL